MHYRSIDDAALRHSAYTPTTTRLPDAAVLAASLERYAAALRARGCRGAVRLRLDADAAGHTGWVDTADTADTPARPADAPPPRSGDE